MMYGTVRGHDWVTNYLDDLCKLTHSLSEGVTAQAELVALLRLLGFHINYIKISIPEPGLQVSRHSDQFAKK